MESGGEFLFAFLSLISAVLVLAIIAVVFPLWASLKTTLLLFVRKAKFGLWLFLAFCALLILRESFQQRSDAGQPSFFLHERNVYLFALPAILTMILKILLSLLPGFVQELADLQEQIEVKQKTE
jgi:hypothetical protein